MGLARGSRLSVVQQPAWRPWRVRADRFLVGFGPPAQCRGHHQMAVLEFGRGGEEFLGIYRYLDVTPKGRDETGPYHTLADWVRPRNLYGGDGMVERSGRYHQPGCSCAVHPQASSER